IAVDQPALPFRDAGFLHLCHDVFNRLRVRFDGAGQWIAAERAEAHAFEFGRFAWLKWKAVVIDHDQGIAASHHRPLFCEIKRHDRNFLVLDISPDIELGPVRQRKYADGLTLADAGVEQIPQFGPLRSGIPHMARRAERKYALLGAAFLFVTPGAAERRVATILIESLLQRLGLHDARIDGRTRRKWIDSGLAPTFVGINEEFETKTLSRLIPKGNHLAEFPGGVDVQQRKRWRSRIKRLDCQMQHGARILADRVEHDRPFELRHDVAHDLDGFRLEPLKLPWKVCRSLADDLRHEGIGDHSRIESGRNGLFPNTFLRRRSEMVPSRCACSTMVAKLRV